MLEIFLEIPKILKEKGCNSVVKYIFGMKKMIPGPVFDILG